MLPERQLSSDSNSNNARQVVEYIADLTGELAQIAAREGLSSLTKSLYAAEQEALRLMNQQN